MARVVNIFQIVFPLLVVSIAVVLLCFYMHAKKKRAVYDVTTPTRQDAVSIRTIPEPEGQVEAERHWDRFPPPYSSVDHPPPYSLFDPILTSVWPGGPPPPYEMYPIMLPLAPHRWLTPTEPQHPSTSSPTHNHPLPQRLRPASTS